MPRPVPDDVMHTTDSSDSAGPYAELGLPDDERRNASNDPNMTCDYH